MALSADSLDENGLCRICGTGESPCCNAGHCEALAGEQVSAMCVHCGSELIELDGAWYHHSQFEQDFLGQPQDYLSKIKQ